MVKMQTINDINGQMEFIFDHVIDDVVEYWLETIVGPIPDLDSDLDHASSIIEGSAQKWASETILDNGSPELDRKFLNDLVRPMWNDEIEECKSLFIQLTRSKKIHNLLK